jgi:DUF4097 and DUF4098 domain-containing protein YvlB
MRTSRFFFLSLLAAASLAQTAAAQRSGEEWVENCRRNNRHNGNHVTHCEVRESRIPARGSLRVDGEQNGGVSVRAHEGRDIVVQARVQTHAGSADAARELAGRIRVDTDGTIHATGPETSGRNQGWAVSYEILVPARTSLHVETHNGPISVERVNGEVEVRAVNGPINLRELAGDVEARTQNGPITVTLAGRRWSGEGLDAETVNGPVTVRMPRGYAAHLESSTVHGPIAAPANIRPARNGRNRWQPGGRITTDLNGGGPTIRVVTTNGPVSIQEM